MVSISNIDSWQNGTKLDQFKYACHLIKWIVYVLMTHLFIEHKMFILYNNFTKIYKQCWGWHSVFGNESIFKGTIKMKLLVMFGFRPDLLNCAIHINMKIWATAQFCQTNNGSKVRINDSNNIIFISKMYPCHEEKLIAWSPDTWLL